MQTTIIVPARNDAKGLAVTLQKLSKLINADCEVVVVDGASTNGSVAVTRKYPVRTIQQTCDRLGKGRGLRLGIGQAKGDKVIWTDADDTYPLSVIPIMIKKLDQYDVVTCSRKFGKAHMPKFNRLGNWLFKMLIQKLHGFKGSDPCTGLYGIRREHLLRMHLTSARFAIEPEVSIKASHMQLRVLDLPITYAPRVGATKLNPIKAGFEDMWTIIKLIGWRPQ